MREELSREEALERFADQDFKREIIETLEASEGALGETVSVYRNDGWGDLCLGPHVPTTKRLGAYKLTSLAGAYWRGDEHRPMLQRDLRHGVADASRTSRPTCTGWRRRSERDHRKLGRDLDLFSFPEEIGAGLAAVAPPRRHLPQGDRGLRPRGPPGARLRDR